MNVKQLKEAIANLPDDMEVILQKDSEGNGYSPLKNVDPEAIYFPHTTWYGDVYSLHWSSHDADMSVAEWEEFKKRPRALILAPVN